MSGVFPVKGKRRIFIGLLFKLPTPQLNCKTRFPPQRIINDNLYLKNDKVYQYIQKHNFVGGISQLVLRL